MRTAYRTCPFCEATCGLEITLDGDRVERVRGDAEDVFSHGFLCPKGVALKAFHEDPERLRVPMGKQPDGTHAEASWDEAFALIAERLPAIQAEHGRDAVGIYLGNPSVHSVAGQLYGKVLVKALQSRNVFSASTVDQFPKQAACAHMFGGGLSVPIPDLDRTDYLLMLGANPAASNGSLMTAPDARGRIAAISARGGKVVVVDPRRTRSAKLADEHVWIRPGTDALMLFALVHVLFDEGLATPVDHLEGVETVAALARDFTPEAAEGPTGIPADALRRLARELAAAPTAAVYGRIGTTTQEFGTVASWLIDVLNALTGNLDRPGGAMWPLPATSKRGTGSGRGARFGRWTSRVRGAGEIFGELPVACLAEEIE
ncbi:MAG TPA: molybdopterin-dependent oxidoreductase, partial [Solirubrobacteraceae bacterium]|nr:molybdopterin-dependent oxidoreductase [Solirubrobacteraceae bacterium]